MDKQERPVLTGLIALVAVAAVVGALLGIGALVGARVLGISGADTTTSDPTGGDSLFLPEPVATRSGTGPLFTLAPGDTAPADGPGGPSETRTKPEREISLSSAETSVASFQKIYLTGTYPRGEGAILQVQRLEGEKWTDFPVTISVGGGTFSSYVQTSHTGINEFRVIDTDTETTSNTVKVEVG